jgi:pyruvate carboxylase subunit B
MRYFVTIGNQTFEVELAQDGIRVDGEPVSAEMIGLAGTPLRRLSIGARSHVLHATSGESPGVWDLHLDGEHYTAEVVDERTRAIRAMTGKTGAAHGPKPIRAPMPGLITRVQVEVGVLVAQGQGVVIMEAMKMENELKAEGAGTVSRIHVQAGQAVEKGALLVEFATAENG